MDKYKILFDLTQQGWQIRHKQQPQATRLYHLYGELIIIWDQGVYKWGGAFVLGRRLDEASELLKDYGFTEQKLPQ